MPSHVPLQTHSRVLCFDRDGYALPEFWRQVLQHILLEALNHEVLAQDSVQLLQIAASCPCIYTSSHFLPDVSTVALPKSIPWTDRV